MLGNWREEVKEHLPLVMLRKTSFNQLSLCSLTGLGATDCWISSLGMGGTENGREKSAEMKTGEKKNELSSRLTYIISHARSCINDARACTRENELNSFPTHSYDRILPKGFVQRPHNSENLLTHP